MKSIITAICITWISVVTVNAQGGGHGEGHHGGHHRRDSSSAPRHRIEKGPKGGKMVTHNGIKLEMDVPSGKKNDVSYYLYDSLTKPLSVQPYTGTVKYVFGGPYEYLETKLKLSGRENQFVATMEGWQEYKRAIATLKLPSGQSFLFVFPNEEHAPQSAQNAEGQHHGGHHHGGGGGMGGGSGGGGMGMPGGGGGNLGPGGGGNGGGMGY